MKRWEYLTVFKGGRTERVFAWSNYEAKFNKLGADGWELIHFGVDTAIFKREVTDGV